MPVLFSYIVKLSISLAVIFLFYQLVLRKVTFYNWNRLYLLIYTIACFLIPFIDINPVLHRNEWNEISIVQWIPAIHNVREVNTENAFSFNYWNLISLLFVSGIIVLLGRLLLQLISFKKMIKKASLISSEGLKIYQVNDSIIPFSFGNSIFINRELHSAAELEEIIRHEFVHVKQKHSIDIIWGEMLCIMNWYNPFAWLLKKVIRQNLEFIADNKVVENGIDKKQYQYLLLKVIGNNQYSIATQFNFSSLKKRIAMMNKTKSAKRQLGRFLFLLPVLAIILLSFRKTFMGGDPLKVFDSGVITRDTIPDVKIPNSKGYYIDIKDNKGDCMVVVKDKNKKEVKRLLLTEWNKKEEHYVNLYGEILAPITEEAEKKTNPANGEKLSPITEEVEKKIKSTNPEVRTVVVKNNIATVTLNNGKKEVYTLSLSPEKKAFENKYHLQNSTWAPTKSLENVGNVVETEAEVKEEPIKEVRVINPEEIEMVEEAVTIASIKSTVNATTTKPELAEVTVTGKKSMSPTKTTTLVATTKPAIEEVTVAGKPSKAITGNIVEEPISSNILSLGGLTILDEGQYILFDGKEVVRESYGKLTGPYRITFVNGKDAEKKYGSKGKNGAILLDTIR